MQGDRNLVGCCMVCDAECFEVVSRWTEGLFDGEIKQLGQMLPGVRRVTMVRASGRQTTWMLCSECTVEPVDLPRLNRKEIAAMVKERDLTNHTPSQVELREKMLRLFEWDIPVGVLGEMPWTEVR